VTRLGYYLPWAFGGSIVTTIGNGLMSTLSPTTSVGKWVGYQMIMGAGRGAAIQTVSLLGASYMLALTIYSLLLLSRTQ
jgi:hypothetical protein